MKNARLALAVALATTLTAVAATSAPAKPTATAAPSCSAPQFGLLAPITGPAAGIGKDQQTWARFAVSEFNKNNGTKMKMIEGDTMLDAKEAATVAQQFASNSNIVGVVGPAGSQEVLATAPIFRRGGMVFVSMSATRTDLTTGRLAGFYRVVPTDRVQSATIAGFIGKTLKLKKAFVVDDQSAYSVPLADGIVANLKANGVDATRESVAQTVVDFSALVSKVSDDTDVVVLPWQLAKNAQLFGQQLKEQGKKALVVGSDGVYSPGEFTISGSYVASFWPDVRKVPSAKSAVAGYSAKYGSNFGTFGPATYQAVQVMMAAIQVACRDGVVTRAEMRREVARTNLPTSLLGIPISFTRTGDVVGLQWSLYKVVGGSYNWIRVK